MNNKLIALAVAGALTAPMMAAEAAPTVYGRMAVEFAQTSNSETSVNDQDYVVDNKAGQFGFKGSEDLGGGLKAIYKMEFGMETTENTGTTAGGTIFAREKMIGLKIGKQHTIQMGNLKQPYKYAGGVKYDSFAATTLQAREGSTNIQAFPATDPATSLSGGGMSAGALGHGGFLENAIGYVGNFKPVTVHLATSSLDNADDEQPVNSLAVSAKVGAFHFGAASISQDGCLASSSATDNCTANGNETESTKLFGSWSMGQHTVRLQLEDKSVTAPTAGAVSTDTDYTYVNYQFKMGKHLVDVALGEKDDKRSTAGTDKDWSRVAYAYNFSKKTRVFAGVAASEETNNTGTSTNANSNDWDTFSVGMQVKF